MFQGQITHILARISTKRLPNYSKFQEKLTTTRLPVFTPKIEPSTHGIDRDPFFGSSLKSSILHQPKKKSRLVRKNSRSNRSAPITLTPTLFTRDSPVTVCYWRRCHRHSRSHCCGCRRLRILRECCTRAIVAAR